MSVWDLWEELVNRAARDGRVDVLDSSAAEAFVDRVAAKFVTDRNRAWWWDSLRDEPEVETYSKDGLAQLKPRIRNEREVMLLVTDEGSEPRGVLSGTPDAILALLGEIPFFEYAVADPELEWLIFDTHHNELVMVGDLPQTT